MSQKRRTQRVDKAHLAPGSKRVTVRLTPEAVRRLGVTCAMEATTPRALIEGLILERSRRWVIQDRPRETGEPESIR